MKQCLFALLVAVPLGASAFCGFYVAQADTKLFNQASKVVVVRDGETTTLTMANDFQGDLKAFAVVFPVPVVPEQEDIKVVRMKTLDHLDSYSAPRLVEYHDEDPCQQHFLSAVVDSLAFSPENPLEASDESLGVTVEAEYEVEEYTVLILSAKESDGLETWLNQNDYRIPDGAAKILASYIKQKMKFFVAKVNLEKQSELGYTYLRPLRVTYTSKKFALPIRLGTVNAKGDQDLFAFLITRKGRVECTNYKTVKLPSNLDVPMFVKDEFSEFYQDMFTHQHAKHKGKAIFLEYAWNMNWCDPCAADPLSAEQLLELGASWVSQTGTSPGTSQAREAFITRLHARYNAETFPEDLVFQVTGDSQNHQGRYVLRHRWKGSPDSCYASRQYFRDLPKRMEQRAENLHELTGWDLDGIRKKLAVDQVPVVDADPPFRNIKIKQNTPVQTFAKQHKTSVETIKKWNDGLFGDRLHKGQSIRLPK